MKTKKHTRPAKFKPLYLVILTVLILLVLKTPTTKPQDNNSGNGNGNGNNGNDNGNGGNTDGDTDGDIGGEPNPRAMDEAVKAELRYSLNPMEICERDYKNAGPPKNKFLDFTYFIIRCIPSDPFNVTFEDENRKVQNPVACEPNGVMIYSFKYGPNYNTTQTFEFCVQGSNFNYALFSISSPERRCWGRTRFSTFNSSCVTLYKGSYNMDVVVFLKVLPNGTIANRFRNEPFFAGLEENCRITGNCYKDTDW